VAARKISPSFDTAPFKVDYGHWSASDLEPTLKAADRSRCGQVAPAPGLYLARVDYPQG
jgi:tRNA U38,U39,U40 pseudouridine synthase TruA